MRLEFIVLLSLATAGCGEETLPQEVEDAHAGEYGRADIQPAVLEDTTLPTFSLDAQTVRTKLEQTAARWSNELSQAEHHDSFSGGQSLHYTFSEGSMAVFTDRDGMVWRARIIAGMGESCHDGSDSLKMIRNLVAAVEGQSLTNDEINMLEGALQSDDTVTIEKAGYRLNASGSCVDIVTATAT